MIGATLDFKRGGFLSELLEWKRNKNETCSHLFATLKWLTQTSGEAQIVLLHIVGSLSHFGPDNPLAQTQTPLTSL